MPEKINRQQNIEPVKKPQPATAGANNKAQNTANLQKGLSVNKAATKTGKGTSVEKQAKTITLKSGRKIVVKDGKTTYYAADGTELKESYFKQVENKNVKVKSSDGKTYDLNEILEKRINNVSGELEKAESENGFIGKAWSGIKNLTGIGDSSNKVREQQETEKKLLSQFNSNPQNRAKIFKELTGQEYNDENLERFIKGEQKLKSEVAVSAYKEGQDMACDITGDIVSGIAAVGIYTAAVAAAPFTGGASIAVGLAAAAATGAVVKIGVKAADAATGGSKYTLKEAGHDAATGAFSGILAPITGGMGGAVGKTVATKLGLQAVKQVGKEVAETAVKSGAKQTIKTMLTNPTGYEYVGGSFLKQSLAMGAEMASDGAVTGGAYNAFTTAIDGGSLGEVVTAAGEGVVGGLIFSPIIGGGMKYTGKEAQKLFGKRNVHINAEGKKTVKELAEMTTVDGKPRFSADEISHLAEAYEKYPKVVKNLKTGQTADKKIRNGNNINNRFQNQKPNLKDPKYNDIDKVCRELEVRLKRDMGVLDVSQIQDMVKSISRDTQFDESVVLEVMSKLTQFGNMRTLNNLADELNRDYYYHVYPIDDFYKEGGISTNSALHYLKRKGQIKLKGDPQNEADNRKAFILDDAGLKYLESLDAEGIKEFSDKVSKGDIELISLEGTGLKIDGNYYSYTMLDGGQSLEAMTASVLEQTVLTGKTIDEVLQGDFRQRLNAVFKNADFSNKIKTISIRKDATPENIAEQIRPNYPDADYIQKVITTVVEKIKNELGPNDDFDEALATQLIAKYYDYMAKAYSSDSFGELLKIQHKNIEEQVLQLGKTMEDVVYIYPTKGKSFALVCLQYAKVNGIDPSKIILYNGSSHNPKLDGKVVVLLDDVVGSGNSMIRQEFQYEKFLTNQKGTNILFAPITCADSGNYNITNKITDQGRTGKDFLIVQPMQSSNYSEFKKSLTSDESRVLDKCLGCKGYEDNGLITGFPYMIPDNNSSLGSYLLLPILNDPSINAANKPLYFNETNSDIVQELRDYLKTRSGP